MKKVGEDSLLYIETLLLGVTGKIKEKRRGRLTPMRSIYHFSLVAILVLRNSVKQTTISHTVDL
jgi:hypothetical protein